jgi:hypothetical protein
MYPFNESEESQFEIKILDEIKAVNSKNRSFSENNS